MFHRRAGGHARSSCGTAAWCPSVTKSGEAPDHRSPRRTQQKPAHPQPRERPLSAPRRHECHRNHENRTAHRNHRVRHLRRRRLRVRNLPNTLGHRSPDRALMASDGKPLLAIVCVRRSPGQPTADRRCHLAAPVKPFRSHHALAVGSPGPGHRTHRVGDPGAR